MHLCIHCFVWKRCEVAAGKTQDCMYLQVLPSSQLGPTLIWDFYTQSIIGQSSMRVKNISTANLALQSLKQGV